VSGLVLVTRPQPEAEETAARLRGLGHACLVEPMLEIATRPGPALDLAGVQAVLVTSRNGARALAARTAERGVPAFAVGAATAASLRALGFRRIEAGADTASALAELVGRSCSPAAGALLHVRGEAVASDPLPRLEQAGFAVRAAVLYEARAVSAFSPHLERTMRQRALGYALFFSPRTARTFVTLAAAAGLQSAAAAAEACCLSPAVAAAADAMGWRAVRVAVRPEQEALLALLPPAGRADEITRRG
jgi:uroporphyrinogen-III synthase